MMRWKDDKQFLAAYAKHHHRILDLILFSSSRTERNEWLTGLDMTGRQEEE